MYLLFGLGMESKNDNKKPQMSLASWLNLSSLGFHFPMVLKKAFNNPVNQAIYSSHQIPLIYPFNVFRHNPQVYILIIITKFFVKVFLNNLIV